MNTGFKIPTLLGLGVLLIGLLGGVFLVSRNELAVFQTKATKFVEPQKITVTNLSGNSATIYWQTNEPSPGFIKAGQSSSSLDLIFNDDRDTGTPKPYKLHFVTLINLSPNTTYYYKIFSGTNSYPNQPLSFKTSTDVPSSPNSPLIGQVVDENSQPVTEAFVNLSIPGSSDVTTITKVSGNFILPLTSLADLSSNPQAVLTVFSGEKSSKINLILPFAKNSLPQIILGQDLDLSAQESTPSPTSTVKYDLNNDRMVNALDAGIVFNNFGKKGKNILGDLNKDEIVDQKDVDILGKLPN
ncbi:MAG: fibronectin type III domain-containing protein [Candidatus Daviesbacteria bacterium]|nr:fibronectin type III domain-containing protein [Candidatus Daviesbacteria bacterium]